MENKETGGQIEDNDYERIKKRAEENTGLRGLMGGLSMPTCQHCYCGRGNWNGQEHIVCCICGHRKLANPITY